MFTIPDHLPRSPIPEGSSGMGMNDPRKPDLTLELLGPYLGSSDGWSATQAKAIREKLEQAVINNKTKTHTLLLDNYATISSHIQLSNQLQSQHNRISTRLDRLSRELDTSDPSISFLPPVLNQLSAHFTAQNRHSRSVAHVKALKALKEQTDHVERLEEAIWGGKGAEGWVVEALSGSQGGGRDGGSEGERVGIGGTKIAAAINTRIQLFRSMLLEQLSQGFEDSINLSIPKSGKGDTALSVKSEIHLQQPRIPRPESHNSSITSPSPSYSLSHLLSTLSTLGTLPGLLSSLSSRLTRDIVKPLLDSNSSFRLTQSSSDSTTQLSLTRSSSHTSPSEKIEDLGLLFTFIIESLSLPLSIETNETLMKEREEFIFSFTSSCLQLLLDLVLIPAMPSNLSSIPEWLGLLSKASQLESSSYSSQSPTTTTSTKSVIQDFINSKAGPQWVTSRTNSTMQEVKSLVLGGWGGWDAMEIKTEREVSVIVEVEDDSPLSPQTTLPKNSEEEKMEVDEDDAWGIESPIIPKTIILAEKTEDEGDAWGFDGETKSGDVGKDDEDDGWGFDDSPTNSKSSLPTFTPTPVVAKPMREAKKLGKRAAKAKALDTPSTPEPEQEETKEGGDAWGEWEDPTPTSAPSSTQTRSSNIQTRSKGPIGGLEPIITKPKRMIMKEEKRIVVEAYLVSKACERLLGLVERCLIESRELESSSLPESFRSSYPQLNSTASLILDTFRALIPLSFKQIRDVPVLSIQLSNDFSYLAERLPLLSFSKTQSSSSPTSSSQPHSSSTPTRRGKDDIPQWAQDQIYRLKSSSSSIYESQLQLQQEGLMSILDEAGGFEGVGFGEGERKCEGVMRGLLDRLEGLGRVLKVVMPSSTFYPTMGYLINTVLSRITAEILSLSDITENESEKLDKLLRMLYPLEGLFGDAEPPTSIIAHVPTWLKYNYISELLHANLVDITYLFNSGALVDFKTEELVGMIKALFADSEKRDKAIERIEAGIEAGGPAQ